ncbi:MAG: hypothetical protein M1544_02815 [Candidatus Marsarchaeota archaeon]|nr:hypothetical protein [Candidatus Marsarchaeota archaeon]
MNMEFTSMGPYFWMENYFDESLASELAVEKAIYDSIANDSDFRIFAIGLYAKDLDRLSSVLKDVVSFESVRVFSDSVTLAKNASELGDYATIEKDARMSVLITKGLGSADQEGAILIRSFRRAEGLLELREGLFRALREDKVNRPGKSHERTENM